MGDEFINVKHDDALSPNSLSRKEEERKQQENIEKQNESIMNLQPDHEDLQPGSSNDEPVLHHLKNTFDKELYFNIIMVNMYFLMTGLITYGIGHGEDSIVIQDISLFEIIHCLFFMTGTCIIGVLEYKGIYIKRLIFQ